MQVLAAVKGISTNGVNTSPYKSVARRGSSIECLFSLNLVECTASESVITNHLHFIIKRYSGEFAGIVETSFSNLGSIETTSPLVKGLCDKNG